MNKPLSATLLLGCVALLAFAFIIPSTTPQTAAVGTTATPNVSFTQDTVQTKEGTSVKLTVRLDQPVTKTTKVTIKLTRDPGTTNRDVSASTASVTFYKNSPITSKSITVRTTKTAAEADKGFTASIAKVGTVSIPTAQQDTVKVTILDQKSGNTATGGIANIGFDTSYIKTKTASLPAGQTIVSPEVTTVYVTSANIGAGTTCRVQKKNGTTWEDNGTFIAYYAQPNQTFTILLPSTYVGVGIHEYRFKCGDVVSSTAMLTVTSTGTGTGTGIRGTLPAPTQIINLESAGQWNRRAEVNASTPATAAINQGEVLGIKVDPSVWNLFVQDQFLWIAQIQSRSPESQADLLSFTRSPALLELLRQRGIQDAIVNQQRSLINLNHCDVRPTPPGPPATPTSGGSLPTPPSLNCPSIVATYNAAYAEFNRLQRAITNMSLDRRVRFYDPVATDPAFTVEVVDQDNNVYNCPSGYIGGVNTDGQAQFSYRNVARSSQSPIQDCPNIRPGKIWTVKIRLNHCKYNWQSGSGLSIQTGQSQDVVCSKTFKVYNDLYYR